MLYTIAVILIILWLLGLVTSFTMGGFIHILLIIAIVVILLRVISGRKPLPDLHLTGPALQKSIHASFCVLPADLDKTGLTDIKRRTTI